MFQEIVTVTNLQTLSVVICLGTTVEAWVMGEVTGQWAAGSNKRKLLTATRMATTHDPTAYRLRPMLEHTSPIHITVSLAHIHLKD